MKRAALIVVALVVIGCGGSSKPAEPATGGSAARDCACVGQCGADLLRRKLAANDPDASVPSEDKAIADCVPCITSCTADVYAWLEARKADAGPDGGAP